MFYHIYFYKINKNTNKDTTEKVFKSSITRNFSYLFKNETKHSQTFTNLSGVCSLVPPSSPFSFPMTNFYRSRNSSYKLPTDYFIFHDQYHFSCSDQYHCSYQKRDQRYQVASSNRLVVVFIRFTLQDFSVKESFWKEFVKSMRCVRMLIIWKFSHF